MPSWDILFSLLAVIFFVLSGLNVPKYSWYWFAAACLTLAWAF